MRRYACVMVVCWMLAVGVYPGVVRALRECKECTRGCACISTELTERLKREFSNKTVFFIGDDLSRNQAYALLNVLDPIIVPNYPNSSPPEKVVPADTDSTSRLEVALHEKKILEYVNRRANSIHISDFRLHAKATNTRIYFFWAGTPGFLGDFSWGQIYACWNDRKYNPNTVFSHVFVNMGLWTLSGRRVFHEESYKYPFPHIEDEFQPNAWAQNLTKNMNLMCDSLHCRQAGGGDGGPRVFWREASFLGDNHDEDNAEVKDENVQVLRQQSSRRALQYAVVAQLVPTRSLCMKWA